MGIDPYSWAIMAVIMVAAAAASYFMYSPSVSTGTKASGIDDFNITSAEEGSIIPVVIGRVKITGNIIWYDNLLVKEQKSSGGGKGGGSSSYTSGYHYYLDCWQTICMGPARVLGMYKENKDFIDSEIAPEWTGEMTDEGDGIQETVMVLNYGNGVVNFELTSDEVDYFCPMPTVCSILMRKTWCGMATAYPNFHFIVQSNFYCPWPNPSNGINAANAIYHILIDAGVSPTNIDTSSFSSAATYWNNKGYGINLVIGSQGKLREKIETILSPIGGMYFERAGRHYIKPGDPYESSYGTIIDDFRKFVISRKSWEDTFNDLKATYTEPDLKYTDRVVLCQNPASIGMLGKKLTKTYDLTLFRDITPAKKRIVELVKFESYPIASVDFTTDLKYSDLEEGDVVDLANSEIGIKNMSFRIVEKNFENIDSNEISFTGIQIPETLFDDSWQDSQLVMSGWQSVVAEPTTLTKYRIVETPRNSLTDSPSILIFAARETEQEIGFLLYYTPDGNDYAMVKSFSGGFCMFATLQSSYTSSTLDIDDEVGMTVRYFKKSYVLDSLSRSNLFASNRVLLVDNEYMKFQTVTLNEDGTATFTGIIRGVMNTDKMTHNAGASIYIIEDLESYYIPNNGSISGYYKICPRTVNGALPLSSAPSVYISGAVVSQTPFSVSRVAATRSGSSVNFNVSVRDMTASGAGLNTSATFYTTANTDVLIEWKLSTDSAWTVLGDSINTFSVDNAAAFIVNVRSREFGKYSATVSLSVGTTDGNYVI